MPLRPHDIQRKNFRRVLRGFDEQEVTEYLARVARKYEDLVKDNATLRDRVEEYAGRMEQYTRLEEVLHNALVVAQEAAAEVKSNAQEEAKLIRQEALQEAEAMRQAARQEVAAAEATYKTILERSKALRAQIRGHLLSHLELLEQEEAELAANTPSAAAGAGAESAGSDAPLTGMTEAATAVD